MKRYTKADFAKWGREGGRKSRRELTAKQARAMVRAREKKKAVLDAVFTKLT